MASTFKILQEGKVTCIFNINGEQSDSLTIPKSPHVQTIVIESHCNSTPKEFSISELPTWITIIEQTHTPPFETTEIPTKTWIKFNINANSGAERSIDITFTQNDTNKTVKYKLTQEGNESIQVVTASINPNFKYLDGWWQNCGLYKLKIDWETEDGSKPSFDWMQYVQIIDLVDMNGLCADTIKVNHNEEFWLYINPNTSDKINCKLDMVNYVNEFPNGNITCNNPSPSGGATSFSFHLSSSDTSKVKIDDDKNSFTYSVSG